MSEEPERGEEEAEPEEEPETPPEEDDLYGRRLDAIERTQRRILRCLEDDDEPRSHGSRRGVRRSEPRRRKPGPKPKAKPEPEPERHWLDD